MDRFKRALDAVLVHEGGYSDHPQDPGGATMKGVIQRVYDAYRDRRGKPRRSVKQITGIEINAIYRFQYWNMIRAAELPDGVAYCVFDAAVNSGPSRAIKWLQQAVGAKVDGIIGNQTLSRTMEQDPEALIDAYCDLRMAFLRRLRHWPTFGKGWTSRVEGVRRDAKKWDDTGEEPHPVVQAPGKAEGPPSRASVAVAAMSNPQAITAVGGAISGAAAMASGDGPVQYAIAAVIVLAVAVAVVSLIKKSMAAD